jgi:SNF2 family DNA or RNA helicase
MDKPGARRRSAIRGQQAQIVFLDALLKLRQICCHRPAARRRRSAPDPRSSIICWKCSRTLRDEGRRVLVFSQFTSMLDLIEANLVAATGSFPTSS